MGKTAVAMAVAELLRERGEDPVAISADALQVYAGWRRSPGCEPAERAAETGWSAFVPVTSTLLGRRVRRLAHAEIDAALEAGRRPMVVGGTGLYLRAPRSPTCRW